jgi:hypothetical protein
MTSTSADIRFCCLGQFHLYAYVHVDNNCFQVNPMKVASLTLQPNVRMTYAYDLMIFIGKNVAYEGGVRN